jgi:hypothetical protein
VTGGVSATHHKKVYGNIRWGWGRKVLCDV